MKLCLEIVFLLYFCTCPFYETQSLILSDNRIRQFPILKNNIGKNYFVIKPQFVFEERNGKCKNTLRLTDAEKKALHKFFRNKQIRNKLSTIIPEKKKDNEFIEKRVEYNNVNTRENESDNSIKTNDTNNIHDDKWKTSRSVLKHTKKKYRLGNPNYRIQKELNNFLKNPPINCTLDVHPTNIRVWVITYVGLKNTIYADEVYKLKIIFPLDYPLKPPIVYFLQKPPKHTHVYSNGDICLSLLGDDYNPSLSISGLVLSIISMLSSAKEKKLPIDNYAHADAKPGSNQNSFLYHDDKC